ncbi:AAA domain-containing protein [Saccharothrix sp. AJ9571]|nr:AAA domain-containing protein [Saccharothrix sp. AJ9571]
MRPNDPNVRREATKLVEYLRDMAVTTKADTCDLDNFERSWWLADLPGSVVLRAQPGSDGGFVAVDQVPLPTPPALPSQLTGYVTPGEWMDHEVLEPRVPPGLADQVENFGDDGSLVVAYRAALAARSAWLAEIEAERPRRELYEEFRQVAEKLANQDDEFELVLCAGLLSGTDDAGRRVNRHLLVKRLFARMDERYSGVTIGVDENAVLVLEDRRFLVPVLGERLGRVDDIRGDVENSDLLPTDEGAEKWLADWSRRLLPESLQYSDATRPPDSERAGRLSVSAAPAIVLRRRDRSSIAGFLDDVLDKLRDPAVVVPQALVQILRDLTPAEQEAWLTAAAGTAKTLSTDPLFSREHNRQQRLVLDRVRQDNGAVVQGPPGTGKTHTIANFLTAMLAEGMRILVVSQREQPLRVLRGMLPPDMQNLCVSLAGAKDGRAGDLEASVRAMSEYVNGTNAVQARERVDAAQERWTVARQRVADAEASLADLRESEHVKHPAVADGYDGRLAEIAALVQERRAGFDWFPPLDADAPVHCPLISSELAELHVLVQAHPDGPIRAAEFLPPPEEVDAVKQAAQLFPELVPPDVGDEARDLADRCGRVAPAELERWLSSLERVTEIVRHLHQRAASSESQRWLEGAVGDLLAGTNLSAWQDVMARPSVAEALSARSRNPLLRDVQFPEHDQPALRDLRDEAAALLHGLRNHQAVRTPWFRRLTILGRETQAVRERCTYRHREPRTEEGAAAIHDVLDILVTLTEVEHAWSFVAVIPDPATRATDRLRWLTEAEDTLPVLRELGQLTFELRTALGKHGVLAVLTTHEQWLTFRDATALAWHRIEAAPREAYLTQVSIWLADTAVLPDAAPELRNLSDVFDRRDVPGFDLAAAAVENARRTIEAHRRLLQLRTPLAEGHGQLLASLETTAHDDPWAKRLAAIDQAWAWAIADRFLRARHQPGLDAQWETDLADAKARLLTATAELATAKAWSHCLQGMSEGAKRGLKSFEFFSKRQHGKGGHAGQHRKSARSAMNAAKEAVPAWVMTIGQVAELLPAEANSFDVVIVDEASQAEPTALFLLWLAPRVIVVGDDKQCTPFNSPRLLDGVTERLRADFPDLPPHVREMLLPNGNLYNILSSAFPAVIRLREHFRCMPEIIAWPSQQFYDGQLVPLRPHGADRLQPVQIEVVTNGRTTGTSENLTNRPEAERVVDILHDCLKDPAYEKKKFGIIALQSARQVEMIRGILGKRIAASEIESRDIRVGDAKNFQGDERDVMLVATVAAGRTNAIRSNLRYEQYLNVAVSRARDQLWLVTSLGPELASDDIRYRMLSAYGEPEDPERRDVDPDQIPAARRVDPFRSLFVQQVYLRIRTHGYDADAQLDIGGRQLDIVVRGRDMSVAVMCDEHTGLPAERRRMDDEALRELRRAGWPFCRVAHSQFILNPDEALAVVWQTLREHGIESGEE